MPLPIPRSWVNTAFKPTYKNFGRPVKAPHNKGQVWRLTPKAKPAKTKKEKREASWG